jgi:beta-N-acetylhexosaminidase
MTPLPRGPVMLDIAATELTAEDRERVLHPSVGGVILFTRNYATPAQLELLTGSILELRDPPLLIAVDHEGGRVQRFREGFTELPPMRTLGQLWDRDPPEAAREAERRGRAIASELAAHGIDFSFTPVLDLDHGPSSVIGDRAFHRDPDAVAYLGVALCRGLRAGGMAAVGKHFPGHGFVAADSHHETPVDTRTLAMLEMDDLVPFRALIDDGLEGMMPAHVVYPQIDPRPAGFSDVWLRTILRERMGFDGMIFSDDLSMAGAATAGDVVARADAALVAGCDMVLVCNDVPAAELLLSRWRPAPSRDLARRAARMERRRQASGPSRVMGAMRRNG